ncbi:hypothetical protein [Chryseobacterium sp. Bi04]|nr:hypothetical protein [Chryseobacterium sp. Bi04]
MKKYRISIVHDYLWSKSIVTTSNSVFAIHRNPDYVLNITAEISADYK